jgi:hypothetical protein
MLPPIEGGDGQLALIALSAVSITTLVCDSSVDHAGLIFIAFQLSLAYFVSGIHKLRSEVWRSGRAMSTIMATQTFGTPSFGEWLAQRRIIALFMSWSVILWEVTFPVALIAPASISVAYLICGCLFHISVAVLMGLNRFVWAFGALYPAIVYVNRLWQ